MWGKIIVSRSQYLSMMASLMNFCGEREWWSDHVIGVGRYGWSDEGVAGCGWYSWPGGVVGRLVRIETISVLGGCVIMESVSRPNRCEYWPRSNLSAFIRSIDGLPPSSVGVVRCSVWLGCRL